MALTINEPLVVVHEGRPRELEFVAVQIRVADWQWAEHVTDKLESRRSSMEAYLINELAREIAGKGLVHFEAYNDHEGFTMRFRASILVAKDQV